jgi:hypothetical protein
MRQSKPEPIRQDELYDPDPPASEVVQFPSEATPVEAAKPDPKPEPSMPGPKRKEGHLAAVSLALDILSFRLIILLCAMASAGLFVMAALWPDPWRLAAAAAFSVIVTAPCLFFYKGL